MLGQKGKSNTRKNNSTTLENKPESTGERLKMKQILTRKNNTDKTGHPKITKGNSINK